MKKYLIVTVALLAAFSGPPQVRAQDESGKIDSKDVQIIVQVGKEVVKGAISTWHKWNSHHPTVQIESDGKTFYVPLIPADKSRGTINFAKQPFEGPRGHDNAIIRVDFVNFGQYANTAVFQTKVDKTRGKDRNRGPELHTGDEAEISIGPDVYAFYFAMRGSVTAKQILAENPTLSSR